MSTLNNVPLGNGSFFDLGFQSPNQFGVDIDFITDPLTGASGYQAAIPNPPMVFQWPENWGSAPELLTYVPAIPIKTVIDCVPGVIHPQPPLDDPPSVPEPISVALVGIGLILVALRRRFCR